jgi:hypothetical protein
LVLRLLLRTLRRPIGLLPRLLRLLLRWLLGLVLTLTRLFLLLLLGERQPTKRKRQRHRASSARHHCAPRQNCWVEFHYLLLDLGPAETLPSAFALNPLDDANSRQDASSPMA